MEWVEVPAGEVSPAPRWAHSCVVLNKKCMLVFGGCAGATLFNDVYVFDLGVRRHRKGGRRRCGPAHSLRRP